jgi:hypothetical protein
VKLTYVDGDGFDAPADEIIITRPGIPWCHAVPVIGETDDAMVIALLTLHDQHEPDNAG